MGSEMCIRDRLAEGLLEDVGRVEALVGGKQEPERALAVEGEVFVVRRTPPARAACTLKI